jgi:hypothetical protein
VAGRAELTISFQVKEEDTFSDDDLGTMRHIHRRPFLQQSFYSSEARALVERIGGQALAGLDLNDRQRTAIRAMVETLRTR